jgi:pyruvate dehydrogenase E1 component alpha subunit
MILNLNNEKETIKFLYDFEADIAKIYNEGKIKAPIHLEGSINGNLEKKLIKFFRDNKINKNTWIFSTHRSHFPWLLSGRDPEELKKQILDGYSMSVFGYRYFTSSIVGGNLPIALGVAKALRMKNSKEKVYCFIGDMAASGGLYCECLKYAEGWDLPIIFITLDNEKSVRANTCATWGCRNGKNKDIKINYKRLYNHAGGNKENEGKYVMF